jgi:glycine dehydrogenase subunit 1
MAARVTGRARALVAGTIDADRLSKFRDHGGPDLVLDQILHDPASGMVNLAALRAALDETVAAVYLEQPSYLGVVETAGAEIARLAHEVGALLVVNVDPSTLGVLAPPSSFGADIACGDIQPLGIHQHYGGGHGGFIASADDPRIVLEYPSRLFGVAPTAVPGEYGFGDVAYERTSFAVREEGKEWVGTAAALWGITAGVYLALMGPQGMRELGERMMARTRYAMERLAEVPGVRLPFGASHHVHEFVLDLTGTGRTVAEVNRALLARGILGGKDLSAEVPALGQATLLAVTEVRTQRDIDGLVEAIRESIR